MAPWLLLLLATPAQPASATFQHAPAVDAASVGQPWGAVRGVTMFRGNPTRSWYGQGPVPDRPRVLWRFPRREPMCAVSAVGREQKRWCGSGWTGQPVLRERDDGVTELMFGAYDRRVHFLDADTGRRTRPDFVTRDIIKGSLSLDASGLPLIAFGSRDNKLRIVALDRPRPTELWALDASAVRGIHNNDWDANPALVGDWLYQGGENGYFFAVELHRGRDAQGLVSVAPEVRVAYPAWDAALLRAVGDDNVSIESSTAVWRDRVYFANGGGRVVGLDRDAMTRGEARVVFDFWMGDDVDATVVVDEQGMLYVAAELERKIRRPRQVGQLVKLDPTRADPLVWSLRVPGREGDPKGGGIWSTPALWRDVLYTSSQSGYLMVVDRQTGALLWRRYLGRHLWSSPVVVDDTLLIASCRGKLHAYDVREPRRPQPRWTVKVGEGGCIESTPVVWKGRIYVGTWDGYFYALGERSELAGRRAAPRKATARAPAATPPG